MMSSFVFDPSEPAGGGNRPPACPLVTIQARFVAEARTPFVPAGKVLMNLGIAATVFPIIPELESRQDGSGSVGRAQ
jgi:hypothetical protein